MAYDAATERELVIMDAFGGVYRLVKQVIVKVQLYVKLIIGYLYSTAVYYFSGQSSPFLLRFLLYPTDRINLIIVIISGQDTGKILFPTAFIVFMVGCEENSFMSPLQLRVTLPCNTLFVCLSDRLQI